MKLKMLAVTWCMLLGSTTLVAQVRPVVPDQLTGTWTGTMGQSDARQTQITVTLKHDGKSPLSGTVTGPQLTPGDIKSGSFDAQSGVLKFSVLVRGESKPVDFEGALANGTIAGKVSMNGEMGTFRIGNRASTASAPPRVTVPVQSNGEATAAVRRGFAEVSAWVTKAAEVVPADKYSYRPTATVRTFGQLVAHVADGSAYYCGRATGKNTEWTDAVEKGSTDKASLIQKLKQAIDACKTVYEGTGQIGPLMENISHTSLHYGNMITYIRMLGLVPPSS